MNELKIAAMIFGVIVFLAMLLHYHGGETEKVIEGAATTIKTGFGCLGTLLLIAVFLLVMLGGWMVKHGGSGDDYYSDPAHEAPTPDE